MTNFENTAIIVEQLTNNHPMVGEAMPLTTDAVEFNKHSLKDLDKVLDQIELDPDWEARLKNIIEDSK